MSGARAQGQIRRLRRMSLGALGASALLAAPAWASGNAILHIKTPRHATAHQKYSIGVSGHARRTETLYMFIDHRACGANPAVEHARANGVIWVVHGDFHKTSRGWSGPASSQHVCAYLAKASAPKNSPHGVLAHRFKAFTVHP